MKLTCLACPAPREGGNYMCLRCWQQLSSPARKALNKSDRQAFARLRELHRQLEFSVPLSEITITP